jgi:Cu(I)/Ag(I) efflux system membrane protein CusA/SilA
MLVYLNQSFQAMIDDCVSKNKTPNQRLLLDAVMQGAGRRVRPIMMTAATIIIGLLPILYGVGTGSEVMSRIAAPMVGGMVSVLILTLLVLPAIYLLWRGVEIRKSA